MNESLPIIEWIVDVICLLLSDWTTVVAAAVVIFVVVLYLLLFRIMSVDDELEMLRQAELRRLKRG